ncbi:MAG: HAD-IA family hydrolase [Anaerolineaceae bacterium]|nr:HAD-IA family hydrolase [Anaerolineaceae bacterium]
MIKNIFWDFDGTLFDTYPPIAKSIHLGLKQLGHHIPVEETLVLSKISLTYCLETLAEKTGSSSSDLEEVFDAQYALLTLEEQKPFPGVQQVLEKVISVGGINVIITHRGSTTMLKLLEHYGLKNYFSGWLTADDGFTRKPDPAAFFAALQSYNVNASETLGVGDRGLDVEASRAAGLQTAFYGDVPEGVQADILLKDYLKLLAHIG